MSVNSTASDGGWHSAMDTAGNVFVAVGFGASFSFGGKTYAPIGTTNVFLAKLSPAGGVIWAKVLGGAGANIDAAGLAVGKLGDVAIAGGCDATIDFGGGKTVVSDAGGDLYAAKFP